MRRRARMVELTADQISAHCDHIDQYVVAANAADGSTMDPNANVERKTIATLKAEAHKSEDIQINRRLIQEQLIETFGPDAGKRLATQYVRDIEDHHIYVHDESSLATPYCAAVDLNPLLQYGTKSLGGPSGPPTHLSSYIGQLVNIMFNISSQIAGAIGVPGALVHMDAFARKDYGDDYLETHTDEIKQFLEFFVYTINEPAGARGAQSIFSNISIFDKEYFQALFSTTYYPMMPDIKPSWDSYSKLQRFALDLIRRENQRAVLTFPVKTATILHDDVQEKDPEFVDMIAEELSLGSLMFLYLSNSVDSLSSCCRLKSSLVDDKKQFMHSLGAGGVATGSLNVITMNMNRIIQDNKNLKSIVDRVHKYQVAHRKLFERFEAQGMYPLYKAGYLNMDKQFLTLGVNGLVEAAESLGLPIRPGGEYQGLVLKVLKTISEANKAAKAEFGYQFNTEFVPAESLGVRNAKWDRDDGYRVTRDCYNSYFFPVEDPKMSIIDKFKLHGGETVKLLDGGSALHLNLDEHPTKEGYKALIRLAIRTGCEYFTTNVLRTACGDCGHVEQAKKDHCVKCESKNISHATRIIGYLKKIPSFSTPRQHEAAMRVYHGADQVAALMSDENCTPMGGKRVEES